MVFGFQQLGVAGVPTVLGLAWLPTLLAGLTMIIGARVARGRLSSTWFLERPEISPALIPVGQTEAPTFIHAVPRARSTRVINRAVT